MLKMEDHSSEFAGRGGAIVFSVGFAFHKVSAIGLAALAAWQPHDGSRQHLAEVTPIAEINLITDE